MAPLLRALVRIASRKAGPTGGASPQALRMRGGATAAAAAAAAAAGASLESVVGQLVRRMNASNPNPHFDPDPNPHPSSNSNPNPKPQLLP